jgi:carbon monoxide dehydrogenase subunit G
MDLAGEYLIPAPAATVWRGMNDPDLLKRCIAVCERFEKVSDDLFVSVLRFGLGPIKVRFTIDIAIENSTPPHSYRLVAQGHGGLAGLAKGWADVVLVPEDNVTWLKFTAASELQGAVARLASKLVEGAAKRYADEFFATFGAEVAQLAHD